MKNYLKAKNEFNSKLDELKKETQPSIYAPNLNEIVLYEKLLELQEQIMVLRNKIERQDGFNASVMAGQKRTTELA